MYHFSHELQRAYYQDAAGEHRSLSVHEHPPPPDANDDSEYVARWEDGMEPAVPATNRRHVRRILGDNASRRGNAAALWTGNKKDNHNGVRLRQKRDRKLLISLLKNL